MVNVKDKFKIDIGSLRSLQISVLRNLKKVGDRHLEYYNSTMSAFKFPEKRMKCHDTVYYEAMLPEVNRILEEIDNIPVK